MLDISNFQADRLTRQQAADYLGLKHSTLEADVSAHRLGLPYYRLGSRVFYRRSDLDSWLENRRVDFAAEQPQ